MNDNTIINIISKTYFTIVSLFIFIFLLFSTTFIIFQNGLYIDSITTSQIQIKQLYIKWDEKINVSLKELKLEETESKKRSPLEPKKAKQYLKSLVDFSTLFKSINIENISYKDINASFNYTDLHQGLFLAHSKDIDINASVTLNPKIMHLNLQKFQYKTKEIAANGNIYLDIEKLKAFTNMNMDIANEANLTLYSIADLKQFNFKVNSNKKIKSIKKMIEIASLPKGVNYWAYDAIDMSYVILEDFHGQIVYDKLSDALKNIHVLANVHKTNYTYHKELDAIHTARVELEFKEGILYIRPKEAYSYGMFLDQSWLKIDFTKEEELLTLNLLFNGSLNTDMLKILNTYKIKLPFLQNSGKILTDLTLEVGLQTIDVNAFGDFQVKDANFDYLGLNVDIASADIKLDNNDVTVKDMNASYQDIARANIDVKYNAKEQNGQIDFKFSSVKLDQIDLSNRDKTIYATYYMDKKGDLIDIKQSQWKIKDKKIELDALNIPFNINNSNITIPATFIQMEDIAHGFVAGDVNLSNINMNMDLDLLRFSYDGIELSQSNTPLKITYDDKLTVESKNDIHFTVTGSKYKAKSLCLESEKNTISLKHTSIEIGKYIKTKIYAKYNTQTETAHMSLSDFTLTDPNTNNLLYSNKKILLSATILDDIIKINSQGLLAEFISKESGWNLKLNSLGFLSNNSPLLKKLSVDNGEFMLYKNKKDQYTRFKSKIKYPYKILVNNHTPTTEYKLNGKIFKEKVYVDVNNNLNITVKDDVKVELKNSTINIPELLRAMEELNSSNESNNTLNILVHAKNSQLYLSDKRSVLYDTLELQYYEKILTAQLEHHNAKAGLKLENNAFHLYGSGFNDVFMNKLFSLSQFENGNMDFYINGKLDDYQGVVYIKDTTIKDFKTLNNILAFVNTVPSLVTFRVPGYSKHGLLAKNSYVKFTAKGNHFNFSDIFLESKEINILGRGDIDINKESLDFILNLKTDLGSNLAKVPLVGYVILGKDAISTTLNIKGDIANPKVKSLIAQDIIIAPINIIKRTLLLPYQLFKKKDKK